jgi:hypothetical protein
MKDKSCRVVASARLEHIRRLGYPIVDFQLGQAEQWKTLVAVEGVWVLPWIFVQADGD